MFVPNEQPRRDRGIWAVKSFRIHAFVLAAIVAAFVVPYLAGVVFPYYLNDAFGPVPAAPEGASSAPLAGTGWDWIALVGQITALLMPVLLAVAIESVVMAASTRGAGTLPPRLHPWLVSATICAICLAAIILRYSPFGAAPLDF